MTLTAWALTTGEAGMRTQARGLAQAIADIVVDKTPPPRLPWPLARRRAAQSLAPPWPDLVVSCGRRSAAAALRIRRLSGGRTLAVHVQDPRGQAGGFDLVIAMEHDRIAEGGNVIKVATALHDLTPHNLAAAADAWRARFAPLPRPLVGVAVGGDLNGRTFSEHDSARLVDGLVRLRSAGMGLAITPSRRTPRRTLQRLQEAFAGDAGVYLWDGSGENPYRAILGLADRFVVTSDSVSMVSEALSIGRPVEILDLDFARHRGFVQDLVDQRLARRFCGDPSTPDTRGPANATLQAAAAVRKLLQARTGVSG